MTEWYFLFFILPYIPSGQGVNSQTDGNNLSHDSMYHLLSCDLSTLAHDPIGVLGSKSPQTPTSTLVGDSSLQKPE